MWGVTRRHATPCLCWDDRAMTDKIVNLDRYRDPQVQLLVMLRLGSLQDDEREARARRAGARDPELRAQLVAAPAETWDEIAMKVIFLLRHLAKTQEGQDDHIRKLIRRVLDDIARQVRPDDPAP